MNITFEEYMNRLVEIRRKVNELMDDMCIPYSEHPEALERILNIAMNGCLDDVKGGKIKTRKILSVVDYHKSENMGKPEYM